MTTDIFVPSTDPGNFTNLWLARKLKGVEQNGFGLSAGLKFDLAAGVDDDVAGTLTGQGIPSFTQPNALGEMLHRASQDQAGLTPVTDMTKYQQNLQQLGYLAPGYVPSGKYDSQTSGATFRYGSDVGNLYRQGQGGFLKATAGQGLDFLNSTLPSGIFKAFVGMGKSLWGTLKDIGGVFTGNLEGIKHHWGEDLFNIISTAAMFTGVGEIADAAKFGAAALGATEDVGANILERFGAKEIPQGLLQAGAQIAPQDLGLASRGILKLTQNADWASEWLTKFSPKALNMTQPGFQIAGALYGGAAKATFVPRFIAAFDPNTTLGKNVNKAPKLPFWADIPAFVIHPVGGTIPTKEFAKMLHVHELGYESPYKILGMADPPDDVRRFHSIQFKINSDAQDLIASETSSLQKRGGLAQAQALGEARAKVLAGARDETGRISQAFTNDAVALAQQHPKGVAASILNGLATAQGRTTEGFIGANDWSDYVEAEKSAHDITRRWAVGPGGIDGNVMVMHADNPGTKQNVQRLLDIWNGADEAQRDSIRPELNVLFNFNVPEDRTIGNELKTALKHAPEDLSDHDGIYSGERSRLRALGYKPALGGNDMLFYTDTSDLLSAPMYSKHQYLAGFLQKTAPKDMNKLVNSTLRASWNDILAAHPSGAGPYGTGDQVAKALTQDIIKQQQALEDIASKGSKPAKFLARMQGRFLTLQDYSPDRISKMLSDNFGFTTDDAQNLGFSLHKAALQSYAVPGFPTGPNDQFSVLHRLAQSLGIHGLPGISETLRSMTLPKWAGKYAFVPERLLRAAMTMRFTMNPLYNARVFGKQQLLAGAAEDLSPMLRPWHFLNAEPGRMEEAMKLQSSLGRNYTGTDDFERAMHAEGYLMNNIGHLDAANDYRVYKREIASSVFNGMEQSEAEQKALSYVRDNHYKWTALPGPRAPIEKSMNFLFFPFSFEKKLLTTTADYFTSEPVRVFLAHEAMRRVNMAEHAIGLTSIPGIPDADAYDNRKKFSTILQKYAPILNEVNKLNAFSHGISFGEPITQGGLDPAILFGAVYKPLADALGHPVETVSSLFHPVMVESKNQVRWKGLGAQLVPALNAFSDFFNDIDQQARVAQGKPTTQSQIDDYFTLERALADKFANMDAVFGGNGTISSFQNSNQIPEFLKAQYLTEKTQLIEMFPAGAQLASQLQGQNADLLKLQILQKTNRSRAEQGIVALEAASLQLMNNPLALDPGGYGKVLAQNLTTQGMRDEGLRLFKTMKGADRQAFIDLWRRLGYQHSYGPIAISSTTEEVA